MGGKGVAGWRWKGGWGLEREGGCGWLEMRAGGALEVNGRGAGWRWMASVWLEMEVVGWLEIEEVG